MAKATTRSVTGRERSDQEGPTVETPHRHAPATSDPRTVLGNRVLLAQPKLMVGSSSDPLEVEADRIAADVVRTLAAGPAPAGAGHECGAGCAVHAPVARTIRRHPGHHHDEAPIGAAGGATRAADEAAVNRARGGGAALPADFRTRVEPVMGADFSSVRVHTGPQAAELNRSFGASAFTIGHDIFFRDGLPDVGTRDGAHLVTHELTHTIQQGAAATVARCRCGSTEPHVQRHSSFEHLMLGNVKPEDLAKVGAWEDAVEQTVPTRSGVGKKVMGSGGGQQVAQVDVNLASGQTLHIQKKDILHVLLQEMVRLKKWQRNEPKQGSAKQANAQDQPLVDIGKDPTFDVVTIMLPQRIPCTYGEMNTLADYFGSIEVLKRADAKQVWQLLQSVRDETWMFLSKTFDKVAASLTKQELNDPAMQGLSDTLFDEIILPDMLDGGGFQDAQAARISGMAGQIELLMGIQGTGAQGKTNKYTPSLGRNACHFVPESWNAWAANHKKARALAAEARAARVRSDQVDQQRAAELDPAEQGKLERTFASLKSIAADKANEALMTNGFGDHYLQDSYAAGHMINKTQIMQFYVEFIDANKEWDYFKDANWRKVQNIAYGQELAPGQQYDQDRVEGHNGATGANANKAMDPQSVENRTDGTWQQNFTELGLRVPPSLASPAASLTRQVLTWLQGQARAGKGSAKGSAIEAAMRPERARDVRMAVGDLVLDGVLLTDGDVSKRGQMMAEMRDSRGAAGGLAGTGARGAGEQLERAAFLKGTFRLRDELKPKKLKKGQVAVAKTEAELQEGFKALTYSDYLEFITSAFLQKSTNALHDTFCKNGLTVYDRHDTEIGRVYGDDAMFSANSSMGVAYSGETSQMSRDAILNIINTGAPGPNTEQAIIDRFPRKVRADVYNDKGKVVTPGVTMGIEAWHNSNNRGGLKGEAFAWIFPSMAWGITQKLVPGGKGDLGAFFTAPAPHQPF
jgi:hypothetical protein